MDERELIGRAQAGEIAALEELLGRYEGLVYNLVRRYLGDRADAADTAQEAMIRIYQRVRDFRGQSSFKTWLYRVVTNICLDALRRRKPDCVSLDETGEDGRPLLQLSSGVGDPEAATERAELRELLTGLLATLAEDHRVIIVLRDMEGLPYEEIAAILGCSLGTVKSRLARARGALRRKFLASPGHSGWVEGRMRA